MKIKEYKVVSSKYDDNPCTMSMEEFDSKINKLIYEGWQPIGGIAADNSTRPSAFQAMVKYEEEKKEENESVIANKAYVDAWCEVANLESTLKRIKSSRYIDINEYKLAINFMSKEDLKGKIVLHNSDFLRRKNDQ